MNLFLGLSPFYSGKVVDGNFGSPFFCRIWQLASFKKGLGYKMAPTRTMVGRSQSKWSKGSAKSTSENRNTNSKMESLLAVLAGTKYILKIMIVNINPYFLGEKIQFLHFFAIFNFNGLYFFWTFFINNFLWKVFCICSIFAKFYTSSNSSRVN